jgi:hypothetical protein
MAAEDRGRIPAIRRPSRLARFLRRNVDGVDMEPSSLGLVLVILSWTAFAFWSQRWHAMPRRRTSRRVLPIASAAAAALVVFVHAEPASAHPDVERSGVQFEGLIGGSNCLPGKVHCRADNPTLNGITRGSFGTGVSLGWRAASWFMLGAGYRFGLFRPDYQTVGLDADYDWGAQHTVVALARPILPIWRFDLGVNIGPGFSRQLFRFENGDKDFTQGFTFLTGPTVDIFVTRHVFLGFEADFIFNVHDDVCQRRGNEINCIDGRRDSDLAPVHQVIYGFHVGGTFG